MKHLNVTVPLGGIILLLGAGASPTRAEPRRVLTDAVLAVVDHALPRQNPVPADAAAIARGNEPPTYLRDVLPIFMGKCVRCHNGEARLMYNWLDYKTAYRDRWEIRKRVWNSWKDLYYKQPMPAGFGSELLTMSEEERLTIKLWVESGAPYGVPSTDPGAKSKTERVELGKRLFTTICAACHQPTGYGIPGQFPPLAGSDFLNADKHRAIRVVLKGLQGEVTVNGRTFNNNMPLIPLSDDDLANVLTYVYNSFGNSGKEVTPQEVAALRAQTGSVAYSDMKKRTSAPREQSPWE